jgi:hypothetical protein
MAATTAPTSSGSSPRPGLAGRPHSYTPDLPALHVAKTHPSVVRRTCGVGTPAGVAPPPGKAVAERTSSSPDWWNGTFNRPAALCRSAPHKSCFPRATGPSESLADLRQDRSAGRGRRHPPHHPTTGARASQADAGSSALLWSVVLYPMTGYPERWVAVCEPLRVPDRGPGVSFRRAGLAQPSSFLLILPQFPRGRGDARSGRRLRRWRLT